MHKYISDCKAKEKKWIDAYFVIRHLFYVCPQIRY